MGQPSPNFGYIQVEKEITRGVFTIKRFLEKPTRLTAQELLRKGSFCNSGLFISMLSVLEKEYKKYYPYYSEFVKVFRRKQVSLARGLKILYRKLEDIPFDKAVMERTKCGRLVKAEFFWRDFGSWQAVYETLSKDKNGNIQRGNGLIYQGENNFIYLDNPQKRFLAVGLRDIFFIDTRDYVLIIPRTSLDDLKLAVEKFKDKSE